MSPVEALQDWSLRSAHWATTAGVTIGGVNALPDGSKALVELTAADFLATITMWSNGSLDLDWLRPSANVAHSEHGEARSAADVEAILDGFAASLAEQVA